MKTVSIYLIVILVSLSYQDTSSYANIDEVIQTHFDLDLEVFFENKTINGINEITFSFLKETSHIILDSKDLIIHRIIDASTNYYLSFNILTHFNDSSLGTPIRVILPRTHLKGESFTIEVDYSTQKNSSAIQWLKPKMTLGKKHPFMYTQCEPILCRSLLPCQDTPSTKVTVDIQITTTSDLNAVFSGQFITKKKTGDHTYTFYYKQRIPIPSYLIAFAVGSIKGKQISPRTTVYSEIEILDQAAEEFSKTEQFITAAEKYLIDYEWGEYNILVLPPGFPYGGMENPSLTFVTPSIISGDKSLVYVIAHEIAHSWTGNLVTNKDWRNFWLNEGFTVFLERKILQKVYGSEYMKFHSILGYSNMEKDLMAFGFNHTYSTLYPILDKNDPDEMFSTIPYEKGFNFLYYLQSIIGANEFQIILRHYIERYKYKAVDYTNFKAHLIEEIKRQFLYKKAFAILYKIDWDKWLLSPGYPLVSNDFSNELSNENYRFVSLFLNDKLSEDFKDLFEQWTSIQKVDFITKISDNEVKLKDSQYQFLAKTLDLIDNKNNAEIKYTFFYLSLRNKKLEYIKDIEEFLGIIGRMKYIRPLYKQLALIDKKLASKIFSKRKALYHPLAVKLITKDIKTVT